MIGSALTRAERAAAYADLYEVPIEDLYRRYGAVLLGSALSTQHLGLTRAASVSEVASGYRP